MVAAAAGRGVREISDRYLSEQERVRIANLRRNRGPGSGQYHPFNAHKLAARRRARPRPGKIARGEALHQFVQDRLEKRWSPQQVSQALRREFPDEPARHVVHETIYQAVYRPGRCAPAGGGAGRTGGRASGGRTGSPP